MPFFSKPRYDIFLADDIFASSYIIWTKVDIFVFPDADIILGFIYLADLVDQDKKIRVAICTGKLVNQVYSMDRVSDSLFGKQ